MPYALLTSTWISTVAMIMAMLAGMGIWPAEAGIRMHVTLALTATTIALFSHTMTMFYFIGTGKKIKEFLADWDQETQDEFRAKTIAGKKRVFPWMTIVCLVLMAAFIIGGAVDAKVLSRGWHTALAYAAIIMQVHVSVLESSEIFRIIQMIQEINHRVRKRELVGSSAS